MTDILSDIITARKKDIARLGYAFGYTVPGQRTRPIVPFLAHKGVILEIKRASPSKGSIAPFLDAAVTARIYEQAGAAAISVLTEHNWFKGSLKDLKDAADAAPHTSILRKDFLLDEQEVDIAYQCGADAVLIIARILDTEKLVAMVHRCAELGITAFIEVRLANDIAKLQEAANDFPQNIIAGVNSRDLRDFSIDPLKPASLLSQLPEQIVYESGITTPPAAAMASAMGFHGILSGEAAARNPTHAAEIVSAFTSTESDSAGAFWVHVASFSGNTVNKLPLVKICGITRTEDAVCAAELGAALLGFVFCAQSQRNTTAENVRSIISALRNKKSGTFLQKNLDTEKHNKNEIWNAYRIPFCIGVITDPSSPEAQQAFSLVQQGILDGIQFHGCFCRSFPDYSHKYNGSIIPGYAALAVSDSGGINELKELLSHGQPRVLIDAKTTDGTGGSGVRIDRALVSQASQYTKLWLAGGITAENVQAIIREFHPELIDVSSGVESAPGIKDSSRLQNLFRAVYR